MTGPVLSACVEAFAYPTEDKIKVIRAITNILDVTPKESTATTNFGGKIHILKSCTNDEQQIHSLLKKLDLAGLDLTARLDDKGLIRVLLNKQRAFMGELVAGKGIKITVKLATKAPDYVQLIKKMV